MQRWSVRRVGLTLAVGGGGLLAAAWSVVIVLRV